jgi:hypothetical protein
VVPWAHPASAKTTKSAATRFRKSISSLRNVPRRGVGIHAGIPFAVLHQHRRVRNEGIAADMVEMEM